MKTNNLLNYISFLMIFSVPSAWATTNIDSDNPDAQNFLVTQDDLATDIFNATVNGGTQNTFIINQTAGTNNVVNARTWGFGSNVTFNNVTSVTETGTNNGVNIYFNPLSWALASPDAITQNNAINVTITGNNNVLYPNLPGSMAAVGGSNNRITENEVGDGNQSIVDLEGYQNSAVSIIGGSIGTVGKGNVTPTLASNNNISGIFGFGDGNNFSDILRGNGNRSTINLHGNGNTFKHTAFGIGDYTYVNDVAGNDNTIIFNQGAPVTSGGDASDKGTGNFISNVNVKGDHSTLSFVQTGNAESITGINIQGILANIAVEESGTTSFTQTGASNSIGNVTTGGPNGLNFTQDGNSNVINNIVVQDPNNNNLNTLNLTQRTGNTNSITAVNIQGGGNTISDSQSGNFNVMNNQAISGDSNNISITQQAVAASTAQANNTAAINLTGNENQLTLGQQGVSNQFWLTYAGYKSVMNPDSPGNGEAGMKISQLGNAIFNANIDSGQNRGPNFFDVTQNGGNNANPNNTTLNVSGLNNQFYAQLYGNVTATVTARGNANEIDTKTNSNLQSSNNSFDILAAGNNNSISSTFGLNEEGGDENTLENDDNNAIVHVHGDSNTITTSAIGTNNYTYVEDLAGNSGSFNSTQNGNSNSIGNVEMGGATALKFFELGNSATIKQDGDFNSITSLSVQGAKNDNITFSQEGIDATALAYNSAAINIVGQDIELNGKQEGNSNQFTLSYTGNGTPGTFSNPAGMNFIQMGHSSLDVTYNGDGDRFNIAQEDDTNNGNPNDIWVNFSKDDNHLTAEQFGNNNKITLSGQGNGNRFTVLTGVLPGLAVGEDPTGFITAGEDLNFVPSPGSVANDNIAKLTVEGDSNEIIVDQQLSDDSYVNATLINSSESKLLSIQKGAHNAFDTAIQGKYEVMVKQSGEGLAPDGYSNKANISLNGTGDAVKEVNGKPIIPVSLEQSGASRFSLTGNGNSINYDASQTGYLNNATNSVTGDNETLTLIQEGKYNTSNETITSKGNQVNLTQTGDVNTMSYTLTGGSQASTALQDGGYNGLTVTMDGENNNANVTQNSSLKYDPSRSLADNGNTAGITVKGTDNRVTATQNGIANNLNDINVALDNTGGLKVSNNTVTVTQAGFAQLTTISNNGNATDSTVNSTTTGSNTRVAVGLAGDTNNATITTNGNYISQEINFAGNNNQATLNIQGDSNSGVFENTGDLNITQVSTTGVGNGVNITNDGNKANVSVTQSDPALSSNNNVTTINITNTAPKETASNLVYVTQQNDFNHATIAITGNNNTAAVYQRGNNSVNIQQVGDSNITQVRQMMRSNSATANVTGNSNTFAIIQSGSGDTNHGAGITANGSYNQGTLIEAGANDNESALITGDSNVIVGVAQLGDGNTEVFNINGSFNNANIQQMGSFNQAFLTQSGTGHAAAITQQQGNNNSASVTQTGIGNISFIAQSGSDNTATNTQTGTNIAASITQLGNNNSIDVEQSRNGATFSLVQNGNEHVTIVQK